MRRLCPTISELNAFHSAAKHQAFTMAARELCVTQSAISRHIAALEDYLGQKLFIRKATGLELTEAGATYLNATRPAMAALESATAQLMSYGGDGGSLNLSVPPTFAAQWLFPRLGHFKRTLPQVSLNFVRYQHAHDFATPHEFDAAIQYGYGNWPSANARYLIGKETSIVCSPQLRDALPLRTPQDLVRATLLQHGGEAAASLPAEWIGVIAHSDAERAEQGARRGALAASQGLAAMRATRGCSAITSCQKRTSIWGLVCPEMPRPSRVLPNRTGSRPTRALRRSPDPPMPPS